MKANKKKQIKVNKRRKPFILILSVIAFTLLGVILFSMNGCITTNTNMNNHPIFSKYVGKEVVLIRDRKLWKMNEHHYTYFSYQLLTMRTQPPERSGFFIKLVPAGTRIRINKVMKETGPDGYPMVYLLCSMRNVDGSVIDFEYNWGGGKTIHRAPWEGKDIPTKRYY